MDLNHKTVALLAIMALLAHTLHVPDVDLGRITPCVDNERLVLALLLLVPHVEAFVFCLQGLELLLLRFSGLFSCRLDLGSERSEGLGGTKAASRKAVGIAAAEQQTCKLDAGPR